MQSTADRPDTPARNRRSRSAWKPNGLPPLLALLVLLVLITESLALGSRTLSPEEVWQGLLAHDNSVASKVVWELRIHRTVLAVVVGASLAVAGVVMQALTRNPLAEPGILGVNAGASLAVVAAIGGFGFTSVNQYLPFAFAGAAAAAVLVHVMSRRSSDSGPARLVLAGVVIVSNRLSRMRHDTNQLVLMTNGCIVLLLMVLTSIGFYD